MRHPSWTRFLLFLVVTCCLGCLELNVEPEWTGVDPTPDTELQPDTVSDAVGDVAEPLDIGGDKDVPLPGDQTSTDTQESSDVEGDADTQDPPDGADPEVPKACDEGEIECTLSTDLGKQRCRATHDPDETPAIEACAFDEDKQCYAWDPQFHPCNEEPPPCQVNVCVHEDGENPECTFESLDSGSCDDGDPCTFDDWCASGVCLAFTKNCSDGKSCTDDSCDAFTGDCVNTENGCIPQCDPVVVQAGIAPWQDLSKHNAMARTPFQLIVGTDVGLEVYDTLNPGTPMWIKDYPLLTPVIDMEFDEPNQRLYVLTGAPHYTNSLKDAGLYIYDFKDPMDMQLEGSLTGSEMPAAPVDLEVDGATAYISFGSYGVNSYDAIDPTEPTHTGGISGMDLDLDVYYQQIAVHNGRLYAALGYGGFSVIDIEEDPVDWTVLHQIADLGEEWGQESLYTSDVEVVIGVGGVHLLVANSVGGMIVYDVNEYDVNEGPYPKLEYLPVLPLVSVERITVSDSKVFVRGPGTVFSQYLFPAGITQMEWEGSYNVAAGEWGANSLVPTPDGEHLYLITERSVQVWHDDPETVGSALYSASVSSTPAYLDACASTAVIVRANAAYKADRISGISVYNVTQPAQPMLHENYPEYGGVAIDPNHPCKGLSTDLADQNSNLFATTELGFQIFTLPDFLQPHDPETNNWYSLTELKDYVAGVLTSYNNEYADPGSGSTPHRIEVRDAYVLLMNQFGLELVDISNIVEPSFLAAIQIDDLQASTFSSEGPTVYTYSSVGKTPALKGWTITGEGEFLESFSVSQGLNLGVTAMELRDGFLYTITADARLQVIKLDENKGAHLVTKTQSVGGSIYTGQRITIHEDHLYVASGVDGLRVYNISNPYHPFQVRYLNTSGYAHDVAIADNGYAYVAGGPHSFDAVSIACEECSSVEQCDDDNPCTIDSCSPDGCHHSSECGNGDLCSPQACAIYDGEISCINTETQLSAQCDDQEYCTQDSCTVEGSVTGCSNEPIDGCETCLVVAPSGTLCSQNADYVQIESPELCASALDKVSELLGGESVEFSETNVHEEILPPGCLFGPSQNNLFYNPDGQGLSFEGHHAVCEYVGTAPCESLNCVPSDNCDDNDPCTESSCNQYVCSVAVTVVCDDGTWCTYDWCDSESGCIYDPHDLDCDDENNCTVDTCDVNNDCENEPDTSFCDDGDLCTADACDSLTGTCTNTELELCPCFDSNECDDGDPCTTDLCIFNYQEGATLCVTQPVICENDNNPCTHVSCQDGACVVDDAGEDCFACNQTELLPVYDYSPSQTDYISILPVDGLTYMGNSSNNTIEIWDFTVQPQIEPIGTIQLAGPPYALAYSEGYLYVAAGTAGFQVIQLSLGEVVASSGEFGTGNFRDVFVEGNTIYTAAGPQGLMVFEFDGESVLWKLTYGLANAMGVYVEDQVAYVAAVTGGLYLFDITEIQGIKLLSQYQMFEGSLLWPYKVSVENGLAYLADKEHGLVVVNATDPTNPYGLWKGPLGNNLTDVFYEAGYVYTIGTSGGGQSHIHCLQCE